MYTLYYSPGAASLVVHMALLEAGADYALEKVDMEAGAQRSPEYLKLNPNGLVPTLLIDGKPFFEAAAALMTIADRHPDAKIAPPIDSIQRAAWKNKSFEYGTWGGEIRAEFAPQPGEIVASEHW